jgi:arylsulfatase A-like enzyme
LYVNFLEPHMPFHSCRDNQYRPEDMVLPPNYGHEEANMVSRVRRAVETWRCSGFEGLPLKTPDDWRVLMAHYWGLCSLVDTHAGRILDTLSELGLDDNTIVVFTSDHGDMMASHNTFGKGCQYEESVRVPLIVRMPGQMRARRIADPVSQIDVVPSLLDCMGSSPPAAVEGQSLRDVLDGKTNDIGRDVFMEWNSPRDDDEQIRAVVTPDGWKLNWSSIGDHELYDLNADPQEMKNLVHDGAQAARIRDLQARITAWQDATTDTVRIESIA